MRINPYIQIARPDHWFKNIFILPGILLVEFFYPHIATLSALEHILLGIVAACLVASSNYVLNEIIDSPHDLFHPEKKNRPIPSGQVSIPVAYAEWLMLAAAGIGLGFWINVPFGLAALLLWIMGCLYNIPPIRLKDRPYADVLSESLNNPLRMALGWYSTGCPLLPPASILLAYWMFGAFLMAIKRFAEYRHIGDKEQARLYRKSFGYYTADRLMESIFFYGAFFGMLSGVFMARYHAELILATPIVAYAMAYYIHIGFKPNSVVQTPEKLYRQRKLVLLVILSFIACGVLLMVDLPFFHQLITPTPLLQ
ncbi:MAG: UbiA prenyltransferase family protein [Lentisphaerota bacterium]